MIAAQRRLQRAQFSAPQLDARLGRLTGSRRRDAVVKAVETTILRDARRRYRAHELDQRPKSVSCSVSGDDEPLVKRNPRAPVVRYQCLAVTFRAAGMVVGTDFVARVDFAKPSFAWCRFIPVGGEGTHSAVTLAAPPPAACIADPPA